MTIPALRLPPPLAALIGAALAATLGAQPAVTFNGENMRLRSASVTGNGIPWNVALVMENDNANGGLASSWRRWWHCQIGNLSAAGETLSVAVSNAGYSDVILPVWSLSNDGVTFAPYQRVPVGATPTVNGSTHRFTLQTPAGVVAIRLAKYFPYTVTQKNAFLAGIQNHPSGRVRSVATLGTSWQGRPIEMVELTDPSVPDPGKRRVWIHAAVHPAETTAYFTVEGLIGFLLSNDPEAGALMAGAIVNVVPMANPDGVFLGNYRTNSRSVNLEDSWARPYQNSEPELVALRGAIEGFMGTAAAPGSNPIEVVLNLHSSHNVSFPFHFRHQSNPNWNITSSPSGVLPPVNALEGQWIAALQGRSPFVNRGTTLSSSCGAPARPFVECMMHDRWSADPAWTGQGLPQVMAITFEGTYGRGPDGVTWNTKDDYRLAGEQLGRALGDHLGLQLTASIATYGQSCGGPFLAGSVGPVGNQNVALLLLTGAPPGGLGLIGVGFGRANVPLPPPWNCNLLTNVVLTGSLSINGIGLASLTLTVPPISGLVADLQCVTLDLATPTPVVATSNGVEIWNNF